MADRLSDLIAALAAATGPSADLDRRLALEVFGWVKGRGNFLSPPGPFEPCLRVPAYTSSLDAITGALEQRWPKGWWFVGNWNPFAEEFSQPTAEIDLGEGRCEQASATTPALALCLAAARLALSESTQPKES